MKKKNRLPIASLVILGLIVLGCLMADMISVKDPSYLDLANYTKAPSKEFIFGTDTLGRDIFSCIWHGGRVSILIGLFATLISTFIAVVYGSVSGMASDFIDTIMMRITEIILSIPSLLIIIFLQAILGASNILSISIVIGVTSWCSIAKLVRTEVRQLRKSEYIIASKSMGGGFFFILFHHLLPNFMSSVMFMIVMNIRSAIVTESTLSFIGLGLPLEIISWGSMLSNAEKALMTNAWWIILIPGVFLVAVLLCVSDLGNWLRGRLNPTDKKV
ncbi:MAG: ABC transporter permease [Lachnospiraceae bacterium]|nr:ABC transporter permease [Lachnospiraceae bacterium]